MQRYLLAVLRGWVIGAGLQKLAQLYYRKVYQFTPEDFKAIAKGIKTIEEVIAEKEKMSPDLPKDIKVRFPPAGGQESKNRPILTFDFDLGVKIERLFKIVLKFPFSIHLTTGAVTLIQAVAKNDPDLVASLLHGASPSSIFENHRFAGKMTKELEHTIKNPIICKKEIDFLRDMLKSPHISDKRIEDEINRVMSRNKYVFSKTSYIQFVVCITLLLISIHTYNINSFLGLIDAIRQAVRSGRMTRSVARFILRQLRQEGVPVPDDIVDLD